MTADDFGIAEMTSAAAAAEDWDIAELTNDVMTFASRSPGAIPGDPLQPLIEAGLGSLTSLVTPLKEALTLVTGDPENLTLSAQEWATVADHLRRLGPRSRQHAHDTEVDWAGVAGDAFRTKFSRFEAGVHRVAGHADHVAEVLRVSSTLVDAAQNNVKGIMASWAEYALYTQATISASARFTLGASAAAGHAAVAGEAAMACTRGAETVGEASLIMERLAVSVRQLEGTFSQLTYALQQDARAMRRAEHNLLSSAQRDVREQDAPRQPGIAPPAF